MCGISGIFRPDQRSVDADRAVAMRDVMWRRGPDEAGVASGPGYAVGHRRLSIIDLSPTGSQPMKNDDGSVVLVFNGEIYNFEGLRAELQQAGHLFRGRSDSEVLIRGYEDWGIEELLRRIRGMYAFALIDQRRGELHLARDPVGKKPLYFFEAEGEILFASSARAILRALDRQPEVDHAAIDDLISHQFISGSQTIFRGMRKLQAGEAMTVGRSGTRIWRYWRADFLRPEEDGSIESWTARIEDTLATAVSRRLIADVPVGILLSGGVDSSLIAALATKVAPDVRTFAVGTEDKRLDESAYAEMVAKAIGSRHTLLPVRGDVAKRLPQLVGAMTEPIGDSAVINFFAISTSAREAVTVVLTGDGGDEAFGGYSQYWAYYNADRVRRVVPRPLLPALAAAGQMLTGAPGMLRRAGTLLRLSGMPVEETFRQTGRIIPADVRAQLFTPEFARRLGDHDPSLPLLDAIRAFPANHWNVNRVMQARMETVLADLYLPKADAGSMAVSLEARAPFLDIDVVEVGMRLPPRLRFFGGEPKGLLRHIARQHVPAAAIDRPKQGFVAPVGRWLRNEWKPLVDDFVLGPHVEKRGWFRRDTLKAIVDGELKLPYGGAYTVWTLLVLELWWRIAVDRTMTEDDELA